MPRPRRSSSAPAATRVCVCRLFVSLVAERSLLSASKRQPLSSLVRLASLSLHLDTREVRPPGTASAAWTPEEVRPSGGFFVSKTRRLLSALSAVVDSGVASLNLRKEEGQRLLPLSNTGGGGIAFGLAAPLPLCQPPNPRSVLSIAFFFTDSGLKAGSSQAPFYGELTRRAYPRFPKERLVCRGSRVEIQASSFKSTWDFYTAPSWRRLGGGSFSSHAFPSPTPSLSVSARFVHPTMEKPTKALHQQLQFFYFGKDGQNARL